MPDKKPLGKPLPLTDAQLDELATITPEDIQKARRRWIESVPDEIKDLLDVTEVVEG